MMILIWISILAVISVATLVQGENTAAAEKYLVKSTAANTYYDSYPFCCPTSPNYDPKAPTDECDDYSGCKYMGDFAGFQSSSNPDGHVDIQYVQSHNLVAFYDNADKSGSHWSKKYASRTIELTKTYKGKTITFNATIADTCGNGDCNNCCSKNSDKNTGYLVDMEYYTVMKNFGSTDAAQGSVSFVIY